ncbi:MAG: FAD-binding protein, partial [Deltaproteobacteria bacterium]
HIPVIAVGRINTIALAEEILAKGRADMVAIGRPLLADPDLPKKAAEGREEEIRPCIACNEGCYKRILQQQDVRCSVNPTLGKEAESVLRKADPVRRVLVIGAGPAGMEAACRAAERGHDVTLIEKNVVPGGQLLLASVPPGWGDIERFTNHLARRLARSGVKMILGEKASSAVVARLQPDAVILATGAEPCKLTVPGLRAGQGVTAWDVLSGKSVSEGPCLVVGAGLVGCETADYLSDRGREVTVVEILSEMACDADKDTKAYFGMRFRKNGVKVHTGASLVKMEGRYAIIRQGDLEMRVETETVVFAVGAKPDACLDDRLVPSGIPVIKVGDCLKPRRLLDSVEEGFQAGNSVLYENPPNPPLLKGGTGGFSCFVVPAPGHGG